MLNWRMFLVFLSVVLLIMGTVHGYLFHRLVVATALPHPWPWILGMAGIGLVLSIPLSFMASRRLDRSLARFFVVPVYVWLGFVFQTFFLILLLDLMRVVGGGILDLAAAAGLFSWTEPEGSWWRWTVASAVGITSMATLFGIWWGLTRRVVNRIDVPIAKLPPELDGFTILQISDVHLDLVHGKSWLEKMVEEANALGADLVAITGDLAEGTVAQYGEDAEAVAALDAPHGVYFVTGNHEYFHDLEGWMAYLEARGVQVLRNQRVEVESGDVGFDLAGVDDHDGSRIAPGHGPDLEKALEGRDPDRALVLLAHQPRIIHQADQRGVDLVLSGHTHGGQIWPFSYLVYLQQPYVRGLIRHGNTYLYVSSGTGFWGPPMRLGTTAEMTLIALRSRK